MAVEGREIALQESPRPKSTSQKSRAALRQIPAILFTRGRKQLVGDQVIRHIGRLIVAIDGVTWM